MKLSIVIVSLFAATTMASPGAVSTSTRHLAQNHTDTTQASLKRAYKDVNVNGTVIKEGCRLCPCDVGSIRYQAMRWCANKTRAGTANATASPADAAARQSSCRDLIVVGSASAL
jgi:hypothetical protein